MKKARKEGVELHTPPQQAHTHLPQCNLPGAATALHPYPDGRPGRARCLRTRDWRGQRQHCCSRCSRCCCCCCSCPSYCRGASRRRRRRKAGPCVAALQWPVLVLDVVDVLVVATCVCTRGGGSECVCPSGGKTRKGGREGKPAWARAKLAMRSARSNGLTTTIHTHYKLAMPCTLGLACCV